MGLGGFLDPGRGALAESGRAAARLLLLSSFLRPLPHGADLFLRPVQEEGGWWLPRTLEG